MISNSFSQTTLETQGVSIRAKMEWPLIENNKSRRWRHLWIEFVVGSLPCSKRFFSGYSGFPFSSKTNIFKFQFDQESGRRRTTLWMCCLQIVIYYLYLFIYPLYFFCPVSMWVTFVCSYTLTAGSLPAFFSAFLVWSSRHDFLLIFLWWSVWLIGAHFGLGWEISFHYTNYLRDGFKCTCKPREVVSHIAHSCRWLWAVEL